MFNIYLPHITHQCKDSLIFLIVVRNNRWKNQEKKSHTHYFWARHSNTVFTKTMKESIFAYLFRHCKRSYSFSMRKFSMKEIDKIDGMAWIDMREKLSFTFCNLFIYTFLYRYFSCMFFFLSFFSLFLFQFEFESLTDKHKLCSCCFIYEQNRYVWPR